MKIIEKLVNILTRLIDTYRIDVKNWGLLNPILKKCGHENR